MNSQQFDGKEKEQWIGRLVLIYMESWIGYWISMLEQIDGKGEQQQIGIQGWIEKKDWIGGMIIKKGIVDKLSDKWVRQVARGTVNRRKVGRNRGQSCRIGRQDWQNTEQQWISEWTGV